MWIIGLLCLHLFLESWLVILHIFEICKTVFHPLVFGKLLFFLIAIFVIFCDPSSFILYHYRAMLCSISDRKVMFLKYVDSLKVSSIITWLFSLKQLIGWTMIIYFLQSHGQNHTLEPPCLSSLHPNSSSVKGTNNNFISWSNKDLVSKEQHLVHIKHLTNGSEYYLCFKSQTQLDMLKHYS